MYLYFWCCARFELLCAQMQEGGYSQTQARGQLCTGPSGPLDFDVVDRKEIFQPNYSYGVFLVHPVMGL